MPARKWAVRRSGIHGRGVFATTQLLAGEKLMEYGGETIGWEEARRRYDESGSEGHTFFFDVGDDQVIDGGSGGNTSRWINHGCAPNVEASVNGSTVELHVLADVAAGEELLLDYRLEVDASADEQERSLYSCRCAAADCRGTMLAG